MVIGSFRNNKNKIYCDFTSCTDLTSLKNVLNHCGRPYELNGSATIYYNNGVDIKYGYGNTDNNTIMSNFIQNSQSLVFPNCKIPKSIYLKATTTQFNNIRLFASISVKINTVFNLLYFVDRWYQNTTRSEGGLGRDG